VAVSEYDPAGNELAAAGEQELVPVAVLAAMVHRTTDTWVLVLVAVIVTVPVGVAVAAWVKVGLTNSVVSVPSVAVRAVPGRLRVTVALVTVSGAEPVEPDEKFVDPLTYVAVRL
jgi:magnesium-transporting ATPase (P-type)